jgi:caffeoyl-CoA O-methyltransferase
MAIQLKDRRAVGVKVLPEGVEEYCERHTTALTELHERLLRETEEKTTTANFLVGELEGAFLKMLVRMTQAKRILEVGMFTGYSALCFAEALPADGSIITCEINPTAIEIGRRFFAQSPHASKIQIREGPAGETLKRLAGPFDLCFIDADKPNYDYYYDRCVELTRKGGLIVLDNMLRYGRVLHPQEEDARIVNALNGRIHNDPRVENVLLPFRDGILLAYKL